MLTIRIDFFRDAYSGDIDTLTGFALVASAQTCFVWQHAQVGGLNFTQYYIIEQMIRH